MSRHSEPVAFLYGYSGPDREWQKKLDDPPGEIGRAILDTVPNTEALFWVGFKTLDVFPQTTGFSLWR
jgi:hypothetical protein